MLWHERLRIKQELYLNHFSYVSQIQEINIGLSLEI